jgi:Asp-tRNA(Asn)/Glu-tRNA(Gln) amidotransferase B subunit
MRRILSLEEYRLNEMEEGMPFEMDESLLDELVELVGSEEEIESAAAAAYADLEEAAQKGEVDVTNEDVPENLALAALFVKLVEEGKISSEDANRFLEKYLS